MKTLTEKTFDVEVAIESNWLVMFWAAWCGPCIDLKYLEDFESVTPGTLVGRVNVEESPDLAATYSIVAVPTYVFFKHGQPVDRLIGLQTKESLQKAVKSL